MSKANPTNADVQQAVNGWGLGGPAGTIICDRCGARVRLDRGEQADMTGYVSTARGPSNRLHLLHVYCNGCERDQVSTGTEAVAEYIVAFTAVRRHRQAAARNIRVLDTSPRGEA